MTDTTHSNDAPLMSADELWGWMNSPPERLLEMSSADMRRAGATLGFHYQFLQQAKSRANAKKNERRVARPRPAGVSTLYAIGVPGGEFVKLGVSRDPEGRLRALQCGSPVALAILATTPGRAARRVCVAQAVRFLSLAWGFRLEGEVAEMIEDWKATEKWDK